MLIKYYYIFFPHWQGQIIALKQAKVAYFTVLIVFQLWNAGEIAEDLINAESSH